MLVQNGVNNPVVFIALPKGFIKGAAGEDHLLSLLYREGEALKFLRNDFRVEGQLHDFSLGMPRYSLEIDAP